MKAKNRRITYLAVTGGVVLALLGGVTIAANIQQNNLDLLLGRGKQHTKDNSSLSGDYIDFKFDNQDDALKNAQRMTQLTAEEGMTLLKNKNNALPLAANEGVTVLGYYSWHNNMSGGEDPATTSGAVSLANGIEQDADIPFNTATKELYASANGDFADPAASLASAESTFAQYPTAVITLKRNSGEGNDQSLNQGMSEQNRSGLVITNAELKLIDYACKHFSKVIVVVNSANAMELGWLQDNDPNMDADGNYTDPYTDTKYDFSKVQAGIWAGCCGSQGGIALANILKGAVNPSGHLVDTYVRDLRKDPTYKNFGSYVYSNSDELNSYQDETFFVEYEEGIYVGYRYYETAAKEAKDGNYAGFDYAREVVFPFGYGLSYTTFSQEFAETPSFDAASNEYTFKVKVTNIGSVAGKGVAQIYVNAPYTAEDKANHVEKAHVVLAGFGKTEILAAGASETLEIKVNRDYFTSFDYQVEKAYILDAGDYNFYLSDNAHSWAEIDEMATGKDKVLWTDTLSKKVVFKDGKDGKRPTDKSVAINKEDDELNYHFQNFGGDVDHGEGFAINFTRTNFKDSFPQSPVEDDFELTDARALKQVGKYDVWLEENNPIKEMPTVDTDPTSYTLASMRGVDFDDPKWDDYMNQFTVSKMVEMVTNGGWNEKADVENGVPESYDADSPYGYYAHALTIKNINKWYCGDPMVAATFNEKLARELGEAFGEEAHANFLAGGTLITGIYGYGLNMHRSAFGGRNYEYYSEDGILAGKMAAAEAGGASEKGLITFMKHYALNDQETNRQKNGYCAWVNEQAFREVYLKGWELYMKEAKMEVKYYAQVGEELDTKLSVKTMSAATGIMTCYNRIGATWGGASVSIHDILEAEFGFTGTAITDAGGQKNTYMTSDFMLRRGGHLTLTNNGTDGLYDTSSPTAVYHLKDATKHILFNKANSNCVQGISPSASIWYDMSPWKVGLVAGWIVVGVLALADVAYIALIALGKVNVKERKEPEEEY